MAPVESWRAVYARLAASIPAMSSSARITLCGMNACVDACLELHRAVPLFEADDPDAAALADLLVERARNGIGGEVRVAWPGGVDWLAANLAFTWSLGGTGPQAARTLVVLGAPAVMALEDRSAHMLAQLPAGLMLFDGPAIVRTPAVAARGMSRGDIYIFDYSAGVPVAGVVPPRSSRIIVRLSDPGLEHDDDFDRFSPNLASVAGAGLIAGFNAVAPANLAAEIRRVRSLCEAWRGSGLDLIHLELAGYDGDAPLHRVLAETAGVITSIGMSHSEFLRLTPAASGTMAAMVALGERLGVRRVCVHADEWAATVTDEDPERELRALMTGSLLASARAEAGRPVPHIRVPEAARFRDPTFEDGATPGGWSFVCCSAPYLEHPASTLGLGDTFTAGCLLVLGQDRGQWTASEKRTA